MCPLGNISRAAAPIGAESYRSGTWLLSSATSFAATSDRCGYCAPPCSEGFPRRSAREEHVDLHADRQRPGRGEIDHHLDHVDVVERAQALGVDAAGFDDRRNRGDLGGEILAGKCGGTHRRRLADL